ncbi:MAG: zinc ribbon domain-containing protein [Candidatus Thorarchaeota archaeon]
MQKNTFFFLTIFLLLFTTSVLVSAETTTETVYDETFTLQYGYLWMITHRTPAVNTSVDVTINSDKMVNFYVSDVGETDKLVEGQDIWVHELEENVTEGQFNFYLENKQSYEFVVINFNPDMDNATLRFVIAFTYEPSGFSWLTWIGIGFAGFVIILLISRSRMRRRQRMSYQDQHQPYTSTDQYTSVTPTEKIQKDARTKVCTFCGSDVELDAKFCTSCGAKF